MGLAEQPLRTKSKTRPQRHTLRQNLLYEATADVKFIKRSADRESAIRLSAHKPTAYGRATLTG